MAPQVLHRVVYGTTKPTPLQISRLIIEPAILPQYTRHRVRHCDYPAIVPSTEPGACVRGTYVRGLTTHDQRRLDIFEGDQYERMRLRLYLLDDEGNRGKEMEAETYVWAEDMRGLENGEWDFEEFRKEKMGRWVGSDEEYEGELRPSIAGAWSAQWLRAQLTSQLKRLMRPWRRETRREGEG